MLLQFESKLFPVNIINARRRPYKGDIITGTALAFMDFGKCCHIINVETHQLQVLPFNRRHFLRNQGRKYSVISVENGFDSQLKVTFRLIPLVVISVLAGFAAETLVGTAI